jgi:hypothetical protein
MPLNRVLSRSEALCEPLASSELRRETALAVDKPEKEIKLGVFVTGKDT